MTLSPFMVYLAMQADKLCFVFIGVTFAFAATAVISVAVSEPYRFDSDFAIAHRKRALKCFLAAIACGLCFAFTPSTKTVAAMVILPPIVNNEQVQALPADILGFVRGLIREYTPKEKEAKL